MGQPYQILNLPGLDAIGWSRRTQTTDISVHHTVTQPPRDDPAAEYAAIMAVHQFHKDKGWGGHSYHAACFESGRWYLVNGDTDIPRAGVANLNHRLVHIVAYGTYTNIIPPQGMLSAISSALAYMKSIYGNIPHGGHRDYAVSGFETSCPGNRWQEWVPYLGQQQQEDDNMPDPRLSDEDIADLKFLMQRNTRDGTWYPDWEYLRQLSHDAAAVRDAHSEAIKSLQAELDAVELSLAGGGRGDDGTQAQIDKLRKDVADALGKAEDFFRAG